MALTLDDLREEQKQIAEVIGVDAYLDLTRAFGGTSIYIAKAEEILKRADRDRQIREEFNTLLRQNKDLADGFIDLDEIVRKPEDKHFMKDGLHLGDGVHPNKEGGKQIASALLNKFFLQ